MYDVDGLLTKLVIECVADVLEARVLYGSSLLDKNMFSESESV